MSRYSKLEMILCTRVAALKILKCLFVLNIIFIILERVCEEEELGGGRDCFLQCGRSATCTVKKTTYFSGKDRPLGFVSF